MRKIALLSLLAVLMLLLAACGGEEAGDDVDVVEEAPAVEEGAVEEGVVEEGAVEAEEVVAREVVVEVGNELRFEPAEIEAADGETLVVTLNNTGALEHDWVWENTDEVFLQTAPGEAATGEITLDELGVYGFYCSVPGHKEAGMIGAVTVSP